MITSRPPIGRSTSGFVYFIAPEPHDFVKIGWCLNGPLNRLNQLQTGCPQALHLLTYVAGTQEDERRLHRTFAEVQYRSEWFLNQHKLRDFIDYLTEFDAHLRQQVSREIFEDAIWDVLVSGYDYPDRGDSVDYKHSANAREWHFLFKEELA